jgi:DNA modification methylase
MLRKAARGKNRSRVKKTRYRSVIELPPLPNDQFVALRDSIAVNGVMVPILVDSDGPIRHIIDGNNRKFIANELGYDCPEIVKDGLSDEEKRLLARCLNLARRHLSQEQRRQIVADQLHETPNRSNNWIGKQLGCHHATVASVRTQMEATCQIDKFTRTLGADGKYRPATHGNAHVNGEARPIGDSPDPDFKVSYGQKKPPTVFRTAEERKRRIAATTLIHGDCRKALKSISSQSIDAVVTDPIYAEVKREYGRITEDEWHELMKTVVAECRRILKPKGSVVFILQPNYETIGKMRLWLWEFVAWAGRRWNLVQDAYWWAIDAMPLVGTDRKYGLMRQSVKMCVWLGPPDCYRNQERVLWTPSEATSARHRADIALRITTSGRTFRNSTIALAADERGGTTPFNLLPIATGGQPGGAEHHPAATPYHVAAWWCRYILPRGGVLLDPFCGSGSILVAGLDEGASKVIGIDRVEKYLEITRRRVGTT